MKTRTLTAIIAFACFLPFLIFSDTYWWNVFVAVLCGACTFELLCCSKILTALGISIPAIAYSVLVPLIYRDQSMDSVLVHLSALFLFLMFVAGVFAKNRYHTSQITLVAALTLLVTGSFVGLITLRTKECGLLFLILAFLIAWGTDTSAYLCGRLFGTRRLAPNLSPKKTVEGSIGSFLITTLLCVIFGLICNSFALAQANVWCLALAGAIGNVFAQLGDLCASLIKRHYSVKDFGTVFPGHGGFMDRFDSVMGVCVFLVLFSSRPELIALFAAL